MPIFIRFGLYRSVIRYMSFKDVRSIAQAVSLYALLWGIVGFMVAVEGTRKLKIEKHKPNKNTG